MGGTIKHVFSGTIVTPSAMTAFTDTQCESRWRHARGSRADGQTFGAWAKTSTGLCPRRWSTS
jgi:hypothetical protein